MGQVELEHGIEMRPGMKCLLDLLRGHSVDLVHDEPEWEQALALAEEEHILPWVAHLFAQQASIPEGLSNRIRSIQHDAAVAAFYWSSQLKNLLYAFEQQGIVAVPLKGPLLAERLYGDAALRVSYDLDLLVSKKNWTQAETVLSELGFVAGTADDYHCQWLRGGTSVELHHDVENPLAFDFHTSHVLQRVEPTMFQGLRCWQLAPSDELLFLCLHGVRHTFGHLSLILDVCLAFEKLAVTEGEPPMPAMAERSSLLTFGLAIAQRLKPETGSMLLFPDVSPEHRIRLESSAGRVWDRLLTRSSQPLDWRTLHSFYVEIEAPDRRLGRKIRHLRILLRRVIGPDYEFAARFGYRRGWQVRLLRPLRLIRDALRSRMSL